MTGKIPAHEIDQAAELAKRLGYLPLALNLAGAQIEYGELWEDLLNDFREQEVDISVLDTDDAIMRTESLTLTFDISLSRLKQNPKTVTLVEKFFMLGIFAAGREASFSLEAVEAIWQVEARHVRRNLNRLERSALINKEGERFYLHLLLGDFARRLLKDDSELDKASQERHQNYYLQVIERSEVDWQVAELDFPQIRTAWRRTDRNNLKRYTHGLLRELSFLAVVDIGQIIQIG